MSAFNIDSIALLARLKLTDAEKERLGHHLDAIIDYIDQLNRLDTSEVEPTAHVIPLQNAFREDAPKKNFPDEDYLSLAPSPQKGHYEVPKIL